MGESAPSCSVTTPANPGQTASHTAQLWRDLSAGPGRSVETDDVFRLNQQKPPPPSQVNSEQLLQLFYERFLLFLLLLLLLPITLCKRRIEDSPSWQLVEPNTNHNIEENGFLVL